MNIFGSPSVLLSPPEQDINIVRGDVAQIVLGFTEEPEVIANPNLYRIRMIFRRRQSDTLPDLAIIQAVLEINPPDKFGDIPVDVIATIEIPTTTTQTLPKQGCVYFIEWTNAVGGSNRRIVQGRVVMED